jgi:nicotinate phosphoribosyltransferase
MAATGIPHFDAALYTDLYQLTMAQAYWLTGRSEARATFDYFFRTNPFGGGYCVFAGTGELLPVLADYRFGPEAREYLLEIGLRRDFVDWLADFRFGGTIEAVREGEIVFPGTPVVRVEGTLVETQLVETLLLNQLNFQSLIATKASRMVEVAGPNRRIIDFGLRRAQGYGAMQATRAAFVGGISATSNVLAGRNYGVAVNGTLAHSWIQSFDDELVAFRKFAEIYGAATVFLVDTHDTLRSGIPNAITVAHELRARGIAPMGIRLDSGDLAYLSKKARQMLDDAGLHDMKIAASNSLDEHLIKSLLDQGAPIDVFGVGTRLVTAHDDPSLDGVYKLAMVGDAPTMKRSDNIAKTTLPGRKSLTRLVDGDGLFFGDLVALDEEDTRHVSRMHHPLFADMRSALGRYDREPLRNVVMRNGELLSAMPTLAEASTLRAARLDQLALEHRRFDNPHIYKVGISPRLLELRRLLMHGNDDSDV